jgi:pyrimidine oxygenase
VAAGQSPRGMQFAAEYADYNFILGVGVNTPTAYAPSNAKLMQAAAITGRDVGSYVLFMIIADETDALAQAKWQHYKDGTDATALAWMANQGAADKTADENATARRINLPEGAINFNMGTLVGSYASVAAMLDEAAMIEGTKGIMLVFDDFIAGMDAFGTRIQPLMKCRASTAIAA